MKKLLLLSLASLPLQAQDIQWEKSYGGRHAEYLFDVQPTADYGFILAGSSLSEKTGNKSDAGNGDLDYWIWKMDENGELDWQKSFGGPGQDMLKSLKNTNDGGFILGGTSGSFTAVQDDKPNGKTSPSFGGNDYWVIKLDAKGGVQWQKSFGGIGQDDLASVYPTRDGGYIVGGSSTSSPGSVIPSASPRAESRGEGTAKTQKSRGNMDYWILKLDSEGNIEWQQTYGGKYADMLRSVIPTNDGGYLAGGTSNSPQSGDKDNVNFGSGGDYWLLKLDSKGAIQWQQTIGGDQDDELFALLQSHDGGYILGGSSNSGTTNSKSKTNKNGTDLWVVKLDTDGQMDWQQTYDFGRVDLLTSIVENDDQSLMLGGHAQSQGGKDEEGINDYIALKVSDKGEKLWERTVGSNGQDILKKAVMTRDGGFLLAGTSNPESIQPTKKDTKKAGIDTGGQLAGLKKANDALDKSVGDAVGKANSKASKKIADATGKINDKISKNNDSALKLGVNGPTGNLAELGKGGNAADAAGKLLSGGNNQPKLPASREKKTNYGRGDFWVVKLKDNDRKEKEERAKIEAFPNPTTQYSNVIVGFEYEKGTLSVYNLGGSELQRFAITDRTIPVDLGQYPAGIYIVTVTTDKGTASMKVIRGVK